MFVGTSKALNTLQLKFDRGEGIRRRRFSERLRVTTVYLRTKLEGDRDVKTSIQNGKVFGLVCQNLTGPNPEATKAMLQTECGMLAKRVEKLRINMCTEYGLVLGQCTEYLR